MRARFLPVGSMCAALLLGGTLLADDSVRATEVVFTGKRTTTVIWFAAECTGSVALTPDGKDPMYKETVFNVCHTAVVAPGERAEYVWESGQTSRSISATCNRDYQRRAGWIATREMSIIGDLNECAAFSDPPPGPAQKVKDATSTAVSTQQTTASSSTQGSTAPASSKHFKLVNKARGMCLDPSGYDGVSGKLVGVYPCQAELDQALYQTTAGGVVQIAKTGLCLDAKGYSGKALDVAMLYSCDGYPDQNWTIGTASVWAEVKNGANQLCLEAEGDDPGQNAAVRLNTCDGKAHQLWMPVYFPIN